MENTSDSRPFVEKERERKRETKRCFGGSGPADGGIDADGRLCISFIYSIKNDQFSVLRGNYGVMRKRN